MGEHSEVDTFHVMYRREYDITMQANDSEVAEMGRKAVSAAAARKGKK